MFLSQVFVTRLRLFYLDQPLCPSALLSPVSPEVRQALQAVLDFLEDNYGVRVALAGAVVTERAREMLDATSLEEERSDRDELYVGEQGLILANVCFLMHRN